MMRDNKSIRTAVPLLFLATLLLAGCNVIQRVPGYLPFVGGGSRETGDSNGERIYFTASNTRGARIPYTDGPRFGGMMMGSYLTCAACHGPEGRGGVHTMHMQVMDAPDIRFAALSGEAGEHAEGEALAEGHNEYDLDDFRKAVVEGEHPDGEQLSRDMPRWQISDEDLVDLFDFLNLFP